MRFERDFYRAQRLWQPLIASELRNTFVVGKWGERVRARLSKEQLKSLMRATHITEIDKTAVVAYNGFDDLMVRCTRTVCDFLEFVAIPSNQKIFLDSSALLFRDECTWRCSNGRVQ